MKMPPCSLAELVSHTDELLRIREVKDWPNAWNGLQIANAGTVSRIGAAVDACGATIRKAVEQGVDLLVVHHGLFWQGVQPVVGPVYAKLKTAMDHNLAIYSAHLPLDLHPTLGNNALLANAIGFSIDSTTPFFHEKGAAIGVRVSVDLDLEELLAKVASAVGGPVKVARGGPGRVQELGIVTGGAGSQFSTALAEGVDTFITGEGPHWSHTGAEDAGINLIFGGHYATETFGVRALAEYLGARYGLESVFIDHPTGL